MPLTELMNYFNDQLQAQAQTKALPKTGFFKTDNTYWARFGNLILGSKFHPINTIGSEHLSGYEKLLDYEKLPGHENLIGYESELLVRSATGNSLNIDSIFNSLDSTDQIIHLDRLVRTLHSLNYLQKTDVQNYHNNKYILSLQVQSRHIMSVIDDHGKIFENILSDCGLGPKRVLLHTRLLNDLTLNHFHKALSNYRERGYKVGISIEQPYELDLLEKFELKPDVIFVHSRIMQDSTKARALDLLSLHESQCIILNSMTMLADPVDAIFDGILHILDEKSEDIESVKDIEIIEEIETIKEIEAIKKVKTF